MYVSCLKTISILLRNRAQLNALTMNRNIYRFLIVLLLAFDFNLSAQTTVLDETLLTQQSFNTFTPVSVAGSQAWNFSSLYGAVCNGFSGGQSFANEDWLISAPMNLSQIENVKLTFSHTRGNAAVMNAGVTEGWYKAFATANYTGNPATTQWTELTGLNQNITTAWQYIASGDLIIPDAAKSSTSRIAFRYMSSATQSATWEIKNVKVTGATQPAPPVSGVFKITNWNTEWLGCTTEGPSDESQQLANVVSAMIAMNSDIYCLQELTNTAGSPTINAIVAQLGSDQWAGALVPNVTDDCDQRQGIIYKKARVQLVSSVELSSGNASQGNTYYYNWSSGRYPAVYTVNLLSANNTTTVPVSIINIHAKAEDNNPMSYTRRLGAATALKTILDGSGYNTKNLIVIGDYNDYLIGTTSTTCSCTVSPYKNFMDDTAKYSGITSGIIDTNTFNGTHPLIENIIISNELTDNYIANSAVQEVGVPQSIPGYYSTTSNHIPVSARFQFDVLSNPANGNVTNWTIYPNPVKDRLKISGEPITSFIVSDMTGKEIASGNEVSEIDFSPFDKGIYIIRLKSQAGHIVVRKVVKE